MYASHSLHFLTIQHICAFHKPYADREHRSIWSVQDSPTWKQITELSIISHHATKTKKMHNFQINILIRIFTTSTYFEPRGLIIRKTICTHSFSTKCFAWIYVSRLVRWKNVSLVYVASLFNNARCIKHKIWRHVSSFTNQDLVTGINYSKFSLLSVGRCWGRSHIHVSKQTCNYWEIHIYLCSMLSLLSTVRCWGRNRIHISKQMCNYWEIHIHLFSMFSLLSAGICWGRSCIHVSKQMCNYWEILVCIYCKEEG
jgi:hypothetical protein